MDQPELEITEIDGFLSFLWSWIALRRCKFVSSFHFCGSIDWHDPWIIALFIFHITVTLMALLTRNYGNFQAVLFFILLLLVYFSESINEIASSNWHVFSRQQYFDSKGLFISVVFSMPILLNCMLMVGSWLYQSTQLMTNLKRAQLREKLKREKESQKGIKAKDN